MEQCSGKTRRSADIEMHGDKWKYEEKRRSRGNTTRSVHFASLMDLCHLKHNELAKHSEKHIQGTLVLLVKGNVKYDNRHRTVSTEQGASVSQVAAARFLDTLSTLHGMACEAKDAVATSAQVHMSEAPRSSRSPESAHRSGSDYDPVVDRHDGTRLKNRWFHLSETWSAFGRIAVGKKARKYFSNKIRRTKTWECLLCPPKIAAIQCWGHCGKFAEEKSDLKIRSIA